MVFSAPLAAQERIAYRVEVIVLRLVDSVFPPEPVLEPRDFGNELDLEARQQKIEQWRSEWPRMSPAQISELELVPPLNRLAAQFPEIEGISFLPERSERMSAVWRNLRLSAEYRPELYLSWEQAAEGDFPALRAHNSEVSRVVDDYARLRVPPPLAGPEDDGPPWDQKIFIYDFEQGTLVLDSIPDPVYFYSVDGTVRLRRSRFLHIDLDLVYRIPAPSTLEGYSGPPLRIEHQGYQTYPLAQSRQIRTNRMEYFDSPVLGALVWVTPVERLVEEDSR